MRIGLKVGLMREKLGINFYPEWLWRLIHRMSQLFEGRNVPRSIGIALLIMYNYAEKGGER